MSSFTQSSMSIIVVNWEKPDETILCLESLKAANVDLASVILLDNGSRDGSAKILSTLFPKVQFIQTRENLGFAGGYNKGIEYALEGTSDRFFLLNNDTVIQADAINQLTSFEDEILIPKIRYLSNKDRIWAAGAYWRELSATIKMRGNGERDRGQYDEQIDLQYATACAILIHRKVFETIGVFDERFVNYFEDYDFCHRASQAGFKIKYIPGSVIYHSDAKSLDRSPGMRWWYIARNSVLFFKKHDYFSDWSLARNILWVLVRELLLLRFSRFIYYLKGYWQGAKDQKNLNVT